MDWRRIPIIAFDTETTGLNPWDADRIIEFAAVILRLDADGRVQSAEPYQQFFNPEIPIPSKVQQLTGITDDDVADAPPFEDKAREVKAMLQGGIMVAHNLPFDRGFLSSEFSRCDVEWADPVAEVDTVDLSMRVFPDAASHKLADVTKRVDVVLEGAHRATNDAEACGRAFVEMARRNNAPTDLQGLLDWADALGHPPENDYLAPTRMGRVRFTSGEFEGDPVEMHPVHLHWMTMARVRREGRWDWRFPESLRRWADRFLRVRASGRARQNPKTYGPEDWTIDSNALPLPTR